MSVAAKIAEVMKSVGPLGKDKKVQGGMNYGYLSEEKITTELHEECAKVGLIVFPTTMAILEDREDTTSSGKIMHNVRIQATYRLMDADDPESVIDVMTLGEGSDTGDKVLNKCMTAAFKYALRQSFMISTGDDPDQQASEPVTATQRQQVAQQARATAPQPDGSIPCQWTGCDKAIKGYTSKTGNPYTAAQVADFSRKACDGLALCYHCRQKYEAGERPEEPQEEHPAQPLLDRVEAVREAVTGNGDMEAVRLETIAALRQFVIDHKMAAGQVKAIAKDRLGRDYSPKNDTDALTLDEALSLLEGLKAGA